ncbi:reverse transcriptase domain-containing protein [Tanacetum coccineum]
MKFSFYTKFEETFSEAWERFKELLRRHVPITGFTELTQVDTFYNGLNENEQDSLNVATGGNLLTSTSGTLSSNTIPNPKGEMKEITTRSGVAYEGPSIPTNPFSKEVHGHSLIQYGDDLPILSRFALSISSRCFTFDAKICSYDLEFTQNKEIVARVRLRLPFSGKWMYDTLGRSWRKHKSLMPLSIWKKLSLPELTPTRMTLELADRSITYPKGLAEDVFVKVRKFHFPTDFVVVDFEADPRVPLYLGILFVDQSCFLPSPPPPPFSPPRREEITLRVDNEAVTFNLDQTTRYSSTNDIVVNKLDIIDAYLRSMLWNFLGFPNSSGWAIPLRGPEPFTSEFILEEIEAYLKDDSISPEIDHADCNPEEDIWVSPVLVFPDSGNNVVANEENELILTRLVTGWRVCIDYRKLNEATRKDHFPLPFMDQMIERLAGNEFYCFLDGFSGYFQIPIDPQDQEKTTFTCPYGTFAYRHMPFGLCNAPGTFQRCIFHDMIEKTMEIFMDDFSVFGDSFDSCLSNLEKMLKWCEDTNLVLN